jgi:hypothetical protein
LGHVLIDPDPDFDPDFDFDGLNVDACFALNRSAW